MSMKIVAILASVSTVALLICAYLGYFYHDSISKSAFYTNVLLSTTAITVFASPLFIVIFVRKLLSGK